MKHVTQQDNILRKIIKGSANSLMIFPLFNTEKYTFQNSKECLSSRVLGNHFLYKWATRQYKRLPKSQWRQQNPHRRFRNIGEFPKIDFLPQNAYFSSNKIFSSFIECTILWDINAKQVMQFEGVQMEVLIKKSGRTLQKAIFAISASYR